MTAVFLFAFMLCISRFAAVYDERLLFSACINISQRTSRVLVSGVLLPLSKAKNPPENRQRLAVVGLIMYVLTAVCLLQCVYNGFTLEPIKELEQVHMTPRGRGVEIENSTEYLNGDIALVCFLFEAAVYLANGCRFFISRAGTPGKKAVVGLAVLVLAVLAAVLCVSMGRIALDWLGRIRRAMG